jgi:choline dehydrogenase
MISEMRPTKAPRMWRVRDGMRQSVFRSHTFLYMDRPNLTVPCQALVTRLVMSGTRVRGVEIVHDGKVQHIAWAERSS